MFLRVLKAGVCAGALVAVSTLVGCAAQPQTGPMAASGMTSQGGPQATALVNQGRFPAPMYDQQVEPAYALTGNETDQVPWRSPGNYYQVGNDRIFVPQLP